MFVPRGVGNAFQTLADGTVYSYLVNDHWSPAAKDSYTFVNLADETLAIAWPIPLAETDRSAADLAHPRLADVVPMRPKPVLVVGASGQLGQSLTAAWPEAEGIGRHGLDLSRPESVAAFDLSPYGVVVNAAAYTKVDAAESAQGRREAWTVNVAGVAALVRAAREHRCTLVHISSDYVFDGRNETHDEQEPFSPLGVYGQTKAAGDALVATWDRHYLLRTSWVIGDGHNFVRTMAGLAERGVSPSVVDDQHGRLTFTAELARAIRHLLDVERAVRHLQPEQRRTDPDLGRHRGRGVRPLRPGPGRRDPGEHGGVRGGQGPGPPAPAQHAAPGQDHRHGLSARGGGAGTGALSSVLSADGHGPDRQRGEDQQQSGARHAGEAAPRPGQVDQLPGQRRRPPPARRPARWCSS